MGSVTILFFKSVIFFILIIYLRFFFHFLSFLLFSPNSASMKLAPLPARASGALCRPRACPLPPPPGQPATWLCLPFPSVLMAWPPGLRQEASRHRHRCGIAPTLSPTLGALQPLLPRGPQASPFCLAHRASPPSLVALKPCRPALPDRGPPARGQPSCPPHPVP